MNVWSGNGLFYDLKSHLMFAGRSGSDKSEYMDNDADTWPVSLCERTI